MGKPLTVLGKKQTEAESIGAGDIGAVAKLVSAKTGDTLCDASRVVKLPAPVSRSPACSWLSPSPRRATRARSAALWPV